MVGTAAPPLLLPACAGWRVRCMQRNLCGKSWAGDSRCPTLDSLPRTTSRDIPASPGTCLDLPSLEPTQARPQGPHHGLG